MGFFDGFAEGFAGAIDDIRHEVERAAYGRETTGNIELPEVQAPTIEAPQAQAMNGEVLPPEPASYSPADMNGAYLHQDIDLTPQQEPPVEPTSWQEVAQDIEPPQIEPPQQSQDIER